LAHAPGRVNIIGEHTDYNDGFVLPIAIDRQISIALQPRHDRRVLLHSTEFDTAADFSLDHIEHGEKWTDYIYGMAWTLQELGYPLQGWQGVLSSTIPIASGLSSSAALELAVAHAFWSITRWDWDGIQMAKAARKMENEWLGLKTGIMDQMISASGKAGYALLIDCRDLNTELVPLPPGVKVVVMDTAVRRGLVDSAYNERVEQCRSAAAYFGVPSLRDVSEDMLAGKSGSLDGLTFRRARHVVGENARTQQAAEVMRQGDAKKLGQLMDASHDSLRLDYEVSCRELDLMVEIARAQDGCRGARMTGAGFGGCALALVDEGAMETFSRRVEARYLDRVGIQPNIFPVMPSNGVQVV